MWHLDQDRYHSPVHDMLQLSTFRSSTLSTYRCNSQTLAPATHASVWRQDAFSHLHASLKNLAKIIVSESTADASCFHLQAVLHPHFLWRVFITQAGRSELCARLAQWLHGLRCASCPIAAHRMSSQLAKKVIRYCSNRRYMRH